MKRKLAKSPRTNLKVQSGMTPFVSTPQIELVHEHKTGKIVDNLTTDNAKKQCVKRGVAPWKMIFPLICGVYFITLPYSTTTSMQTTVGLYLTCISCLLYSIGLILCYIRLVPTRAKYCAIRKEQKMIVKQAVRQKKISAQADKERKLSASRHKSVAETNVN